MPGLIGILMFLHSVYPSQANREISLAVSSLECNDTPCQNRGRNDGGGKDDSHQDPSFIGY